MFIGLALSLAGCLLSLHLTASSLPYYERIFLRSVIAARVGFQYRYAGNRKEIRNNKEKNLLMAYGRKEVQDEQMLRYIEQFQDLDEKREGLDFEINDLL